VIASVDIAKRSQEHDPQFARPERLRRAALTGGASTLARVVQIALRLTVPLTFEVFGQRAIWPVDDD